MTREEWKEVIGKAQEAAFTDYYKTIDADEHLRLIFTLLNYIHDAL